MLKRVVKLILLVILIVGGAYLLLVGDSNKQLYNIALIGLIICSAVINIILIVKKKSRKK